MRYEVECDLRYFNFWAGAKDRMDDATDEQRQAVYERIESIFECYESLPSETDINGLVWFECDDIFFPDEDESEEE